MVKKITCLGVCLLLLTGCGKIAELQNGEQAVVSLEKEAAISVDSLYEELKNSYGVTKLIEMVDKIILNKEYGKEDEEKTKYVEDNIAQLKAYYPEEAEFLQVIQSYYGISSEEEFVQFLELNYLKEKATLDYAKTKVKDKEISKYHKDTLVGDIKASHILIKPETKENMTSEEQIKAEEKALKKAEDLIKKLKESKDIAKDFEKLAKENSDDTGSAEKGGDLGYFNKGVMVSEFEEAAYKLKDNNYTKKPVKTTHGYHIIFKTDTKAKPSLKDATKDIKETLAKEKMATNPTYQIDAMTDLRKKYDFKIEDSELSKQYGNYIQYLLKQATEQNAQN